jgi:acetyl-CoA C-acetyltransferase
MIASASAAGAPELAPLGAIWATEKLIKKQGVEIRDVDLFEINESFALKPLAFSRKFAVDHEKINVLGGNLAFGHPFGASGAMNLLHLVRALEVNNKKLGLVAMGAAGGQGLAMLIERIS